MAGYKVFLKAGSEPDVDVDAPAATLATSAVSWTEAIATLSLDPDEVYHLALLAFNDLGASPAIRTVFRTDGAGAPLMRPSPVTNLRVHRLPGGEADITFDYAELAGGPMADSFGFEIASLDGGDPIEVDDLPVGGLHYRTRISGADGRYRCKVFSQLSGDYEPAVSGVDFTLDSTAPVGSVSEFAVI